MQCRRQFERVAFFCPLQLIALPEGVAVPGNSFDVSMGGVGITAETSLERGQAVCVRFHLKNGPNGARDEEVLGRVAYARADEDGNRLGIEFLQPIRASTHPLLAQTVENL